MSDARLRSSLVALAALTALCCLGSPAAAQTTGDLQGRVQDGQGSPLQAVAIKLLHAGGKDTREQASDAAGDFRFAGLNGVYVATASLDGYAPVTCPGVRIVGVSRQIEIKLMPTGGAEPSSCTVLPAQ
jgi:hypothetical protein